MKIHEINKILENGIYPVVRFTKTVEDVESRFEEGMMAYLMNIGNDDGNELCELTFEEKDFAEYNKQLEKPVWCKDYGREYIYKFSEVNEDWRGVDTYYEDTDGDVVNFELVNNKSLKLFEKYQQYMNNDLEEIKMTYLQWLENQIIIDEYCG